ncbi:uncharacterized protein LOC120010585 [Tripterygium wilfordii]|uniref:uncharacterized protein LOC120010585 n=1 Tax=Tripterygium wilfordii TaxID=458696 RepID=UPI0018F83319|nr:uncharacterized protein LOC120010585 [Tripterygium wilfordii]
MNRLLRYGSSSSARNSLIRIVSVAALGSGLLYANSDSYYRIRVTTSIHAPSRESLSLLPWSLSENLSPRPSFFSAEQWQFGDLRLFSSQVSPVLSEDIRKEAPGGEGDSAKQYVRYIGRDTIAAAAARVGPAVVNISVPRGLFGITIRKSIGSGTIIDDGGTILTCAHAVVDFPLPAMRIISKGKVEVTLQDGRTFEGTVVNVDLHLDIAIVKINSSTPLPSAKLGSSSKLRTGDWVLAMGSPHSLQNTVTAGIVSCADRKSSDLAHLGIGHLGIGRQQREYIQTDCATYPGNSGGPLVNIDGEVVGVYTLKAMSADGLGFCVPIDAVSKIIEHFNKSGRVIRPWLGLKTVDLNEMLIAQLKEKDAKFSNVSSGVLVQMVAPDSPADRAGFRHGDVVIEFDGMPVKSCKEVNLQIVEIMEDRIGVPLKVVVKRANDNVVTLTVVPDEANPETRGKQKHLVLRGVTMRGNVGVVQKGQSATKIHPKKLLNYGLGLGLIKSRTCAMDKMNQLLRNASSSSARNSLIRIVSVAALGSGLFYANSDSYSRTRVTVSIHAPFRESLSLLPWHLSGNLGPRPSFLSSKQWQFGDIPLFSSRVSPAPSEDIRKEAPGGEGDGAKKYVGYIGRDTIADAAARVGPAVVNISVPQGFRGITTGKSIGSGTIIDASGTILTCAHVVVDFQGMRTTSKGKVDVTLQDGRTFEGTVVNADLHSDVAIVKINSRTPLPAAKLGSSGKLRPGDWVLAMGCPLSLQNTVTAGIVSCVDRKSSDLGIWGQQREYLQTDCAINAGNSGGPLVNIDGEVVGVNIMKVLAADGLSFSVPIDAVSKIIEHFNKSGRVIRPWLGLKMVDLNELIVALLKERDPKFANVSRGVLVQMVTPGSPADRARFQPGDVVIKFDGKPIESVNEIIEVMGDTVGVPLKVVVKREDNVVTLTVVSQEANLAV